MGPRRGNRLDQSGIVVLDIADTRYPERIKAAVPRLSPPFGDSLALDLVPAGPRRDRR
jgi:hypothetical protein